MRAALFTLPSCLLTLACACAPAARATTINFITNGSFEQNSVSGNTSSFTGWTIGGTNGTSPGYGPEVFTTDGVTKNRYGDVVSADNAVSPYPDSDKAGTHAVYFVDDSANETLSQTIYLTPGTYEVGFDAFATASGYGNAGGATLNAQIAGTTITNASVSSLPKATWEHFAANVTIYAAAYYTYTFDYVSQNGASKDVVVDDVYVISPSTLTGAGTYIPAPGALAAAPLLACRLLSRRRRTGAA